MYFHYVGSAELSVSQ